MFIPFNPFLPILLLVALSFSLIFFIFLRKRKRLDPVTNQLVDFKETKIAYILSLASLFIFTLSSLMIFLILFLLLSVPELIIALLWPIWSLFYPGLEALPRGFLGYSLLGLYLVEIFFLFFSFIFTSLDKNKTFQKVRLILVVLLGLGFSSISFTGVYGTIAEEQKRPQRAKQQTEQFEQFEKERLQENKQYVEVIQRRFPKLNEDFIINKGRLDNFDGIDIFTLNIEDSKDYPCLNGVFVRPKDKRLFYTTLASRSTLGAQSYKDLDKKCPPLDDQVKLKVKFVGEGIVLPSYRPGEYPPAYLSVAVPDFLSWRVQLDETNQTELTLMKGEYEIAFLYAPRNTKSGIQIINLGKDTTVEIKIKDYLSNPQSQRGQFY